MSRQNRSMSRDGLDIAKVSFASIITILPVLVILLILLNGVTIFGYTLDVEISLFSGIVLVGIVIGLYILFRCVKHVLR